MGMDKLPDDDQPEWLADAIGMDYYGIEITDAYLATSTTQWRGGGSTVVGLELSAKRSSKGFWYYNESHEQWYWSGGSVKEVSRKALEEVIKPNFTPPQKSA